MFLDPVTGSRTIGVQSTAGGGGLRLLLDTAIRLDWMGRLLAELAATVDKITAARTADDGPEFSFWLDCKAGTVGITTMAASADELFLASGDNSCFGSVGNVVVLIDGCGSADEGTAASTAGLAVVDWPRRLL